MTQEWVPGHNETDDTKKKKMKKETQVHWKLTEGCNHSENSTKVLQKAY